MKTFFFGRIGPGFNAALQKGGQSCVLGGVAGVLGHVSTAPHLLMLLYVLLVGLRLGLGLGLDLSLSLGVGMSLGLVVDTHVRWRNATDWHPDGPCTAGRLLLLLGQLRVCWLFGRINAVAMR